MDSLLRRGGLRALLLPLPAQARLANPRVSSQAPRRGRGLPAAFPPPHDLGNLGNSGLDITSAATSLG